MNENVFASSADDQPQIPPEQPEKYSLENSSGSRPPFLKYYAWWGGIWLSVIFLANLPKEVELIKNNGFDMTGEAWYWFLVICVSLVWAFFSWLLLWAITAYSSRISLNHKSLAMLPTYAALIVGLLFGLPAAGFIDFAETVPTPDDPSISATSSGIEVIGIVIAFPLATFVAAKMIAGTKGES